MLAALLAVLAAPASAAPRWIDLPEPCVLTTSPHATPAHVLARRAEFTCGRKDAARFGVTNWALIDGLTLKNEPTDPLIFRHALVRDWANSYYFVYADGRIVQSPTSDKAARQILSSGDVRYEIPPAAAPLKAVLVRIGDLHNMHGSVPRPGIDTRSAVALTNANFHLFYGAFGGLLAAMLLYNLMLYMVLRHRFLLHYCGFTTSVLAFAGSWSGGIFLLFPGLSTFGQVMTNIYAIAAMMLFTGAFMFSFLEPGMVPRRVQRAVTATSLMPIAIALVRLSLPDSLWRMLDIIFYGAIILTLASMVVAGAVAWRRGSRAARLYAISWSAPFAFAMARAIWALGLLPFHSGFFDISLFVVLALEVVISAAGIVWRIRTLREERDDAVALEAKLRLLAETDPLTGLLNRRAFLDRAREGDHDKRLILIDIDRFKAINDGFGHDVGDQVIRAVAQTLQRVSPPDSLVGRMGGEEFAVLVPACAPGELAYALREAVEQPAFGGGPPVTISAGVAEGPISDEPDWRLLYIAADEALYEAKNGGRNRVKHSFARAAA